MADNTNKTNFLADRRVLAVAGLVLLVILLVAVNAVSARLFRGAAVDMTGDKLFTLSEGTREVLKNIDEPITLRFYYSKALGERAPSLVPYVTRVREFLERYRDLSNGKIRLEMLDPAPFTDTEDKAVSAGLQGINLSQRSDEKGYFGLAGTNSTDDREIIPFFNLSRETFLEYDLTRLVSRLAHPKKKVVGLLTGLRLSHPPQRRGAYGRPWVILQQIGGRFELKQIAAGVSKIDEEVDVLMVVHPKRLPNETLYAIDQYVLNGGKAIFFIDPHAEGATRGRRMGLFMLDSGSEMNKILDSWGIEVTPNRVVGDPTNAVRVQVPTPGGRQQIVEYLAWMALGKRYMNRDDVITAELKRINIASPGSIVHKTAKPAKPAKGAAKGGAKPAAKTKKPAAKPVAGPAKPLVITRLLISSPQAMKIDAIKLRIRPNLPQLLADHKAGGRALVMAARLKGEVPSAFPKGPPAPKKPTKKQTEAQKKEAAKTAAALKKAHVAKSKGPINVIIVADTDLMDDRFWVRQQNYYGRTVAVAAADNGAFVINAIDDLTGSTGMIGLRSRGQVARPFTLVQKKQNQASLRYRAKEQALLKKLETTRKKLRDLQRTSSGGNENILTPAQLKEIEKFRAEILKTRRELRQVQLALRRDIDRLETQMQFLTIGAVPLVIAIFAAAMGIVRRRRRRQTHQAATG